MRGEEWGAKDDGNDKQKPKISVECRIKNENARRDLVPM